MGSVSIWSAAIYHRFGLCSIQSGEESPHSKTINYLPMHILDFIHALGDDTVRRS
jgi:hypothetical protein